MEAGMSMFCLNAAMTGRGSRPISSTGIFKGETAGLALVSSCVISETVSAEAPCA